MVQRHVKRIKINKNTIENLLSQSYVYLLIDMIEPDTEPKSFGPDMLAIKTLYTFNMNPNDDHQYFNDEDDRLRYCIRYLINNTMWKFINNRTTIKFVLVPEIDNSHKYSGPPKKNRVHFHGTIIFKTIKDIKMWYYYIYNVLTKNFSVEVDTIENKDTWFNYMYKNKDTMQMFCQIDKIPYKITETTSKLDNDMNVIEESTQRIYDGFLKQYRTIKKETYKKVRKKGYKQKK